VSDLANGPVADEPIRSKSPSRRGFLTGALTLGGSVGLGVPAPTARAEPAKGGAAVNPRLFSFVGGKAGEWSVVSAKAVVGDPFPETPRSGNRRPGGRIRQDGQGRPVHAPPGQLQEGLRMDGA
jgi:hypothetical protein